MVGRGWPLAFESGAVVLGGLSRLVMSGVSKAAIFFHRCVTGLGASDQIADFHHMRIAKISPAKQDGPYRHKLKLKHNRF